MPSRLLLPSLLCAAALAAIAGPAQAQLVSKSPFLPPQSAAAAGPTADAPIEFRAYLSTSEGSLYRIYDPGKKVGFWLKADERNPDFEVVVRQFDEDQNTLTVEHQGKTLTLALRTSKVVSSGTGPQMPMPLPQPVNAPHVSPAVTQSVVLNPGPADETRRLEAVAAEVARRRALREQSMGNAQPPPAPVAAPQLGQPQPLPSVNRPASR